MNYQKICMAEGIALIFVVMVNQVLLGTAKNIVITTASSAWLNTLFIILIGLALVFIITKLFKKFTNFDIIDISEYIGGKILKTIIGIISIVFFVFSAALILHHICDCLEIIYFSNINVLFLQLVFLLGAAFCAKKGIAAVSKTNLIFVAILIIPMIILWISLLFHMEIKHFFPILGYGFNNTFFGNSTNIYAFSGLIYLFFIMPFLNNSKEFSKIGFIGFIMSSIYLFLTVVSLLLSFPFSAITEELLSIYLLSRLVSIGSFIERVDALYVFLWILSSFSYLSTLILFTCNNFKKITNIKNPNGMIFAAMYIIFGSALLISDVSDFRFLQLTVFKYFTICLLVLFTIILFIGYLKKRRSPNNISETQTKQLE